MIPMRPSGLNHLNKLHEGAATRAQNKKKKKEQPRAIYIYRNATACKGGTVVQQRLDRDTIQMLLRPNQMVLTSSSER